MVYRQIIYQHDDRRQRPDPSENGRIRCVPADLESNEARSTALRHNMQRSSNRTPPRTPKTGTRNNGTRDPPSSAEEYIEYRRQLLKEDEKINGITKYSTIRFSQELEIYTKQTSKRNSNTPTRSILRTKSKGNGGSRKPSKRNKDALLEKMKMLSPNRNNNSSLLNTASSRKSELVPPRQDWNLASLFPSSKENKQKYQRSVIGSRGVGPANNPMQNFKNERVNSSEYLLNKYTVNTNSPLANMDGLKNKVVDLEITPCLSSNDIGIEFPSTPKVSENRRRKPFSDSKIYENSTTRRRSTRKQDKNKLSYLQLEENNSDEENI